MALATTCPQCKTSFKVVPDQLKLRRGLVRCGVCQHVFSGIDFLRYVDEAGQPLAGAAPAAAAVDEPAAPSPSAAPAARAARPGRSPAAPSAASASPGPGPRPARGPAPAPRGAPANPAASAPAASTAPGPRPGAEAGSLQRHPAPPARTPVAAAEPAPGSGDDLHTAFYLADSNEGPFAQPDPTDFVPPRSIIHADAGTGAGAGPGASDPRAGSGGDSGEGEAIRAADAQAASVSGAAAGTNTASGSGWSPASNSDSDSDPAEDPDGDLAPASAAGADADRPGLEADRPRRGNGPGERPRNPRRRNPAERPAPRQPWQSLAASADVDNNPPSVFDPGLSGGDRTAAVAGEAIDQAYPDSLVDWLAQGSEPSAASTPAPGADGPAEADDPGSGAAAARLADGTGADDDALPAGARSRRRLRGQRRQAEGRPGLADREQGRDNRLGAGPVVGRDGDRNGGRNGDRDSDRINDRDSDRDGDRVDDAFADPAARPAGQPQAPRSTRFPSLADEPPLSPRLSDDESGLYHRVATLFDEAHRRKLLIGLAVLAVVQLALTFRDGLSSSIPMVRPVLGLIGAPFGLGIEPLRQIDDITLEAFEIQDLRVDNTYRLSAIIRNRSNRAVRWPAMELTLVDPNRTVVVRKVIGPEVYLGRLDRRDGIAPRSESPIRLTIRTRDVQMAGYNVSLFYP